MNFSSLSAHFMVKYFNFSDSLVSIEILPFPLVEGEFQIDSESLAKLYGLKKVREAFSIIMPWLDERDALVSPN